MKVVGQIRFIQCNYSQYSSRYNQLLNGETPNVFNPVLPKDPNLNRRL